MAQHPELKLQPGRHKRLKTGHPWVYSNEVAEPKALKALEPGALVTVVANSGERLGTACYSHRPLIGARLFTRRADAEIGVDFLGQRLKRALDLRDRLFDEPFYRLVHAEADGLPGLIVDRFGSAVVLQLNIAGMEALRAELLEAVDAVVAPDTVILRNDSPMRALEGLDSAVEVIRGDGDLRLPVFENGVAFFAAPASGQKTGWYFDQRDNRTFIAGLARERTVLDVYCHSGGFAVHAAAAGASEVLGIDGSAAALELAGQAAVQNGVAARCRFTKADAFAEMQRLGGAGSVWDVVVVDPPSFVKSKKDLHAGLRGYRKMVRLAVPLVAPGGILFVASCSHNVSVEAFAHEVARGLSDAGRQGRILRAAGAAPDHPVHPSLPETAYLKSLTLALD